MDFFFGKKKTPEELLREHQRSLKRAIRDLDRERAALQRQEKALVLEIRKMAKQDQMGAVRIMARDLVRTRNHVQKFYEMKAELQAVSLRISTLRSQAAMGTAMKGVTKTMIRMNKQMDIPEMRRVMMEFEKQSDIMDMKEEMMAEVMEETLDTEEDEKVADGLVSQVLDELGIEMSEKLASAPNHQVGEQQSGSEQQRQAVAEGGAGGGGDGGMGVPSVEKSDPDHDLFARFAKLQD